MPLIYLHHHHCTPSNLTPGLACQGSGRRESAEDYFRLSLELDPLMWVNVQSLCELGADLDVDKHFEEAFFKRTATGTVIGTNKGSASTAGAEKGGSQRTQPAVGGGGGGRRRPPWAHYMALSRGSSSRCPGCLKSSSSGARTLHCCCCYCFSWSFLFTPYTVFLFFFA